MHYARALMLDGNGRRSPHTPKGLELLPLEAWVLVVEQATFDLLLGTI